LYFRVLMLLPDTSKLKGIVRMNRSISGLIARRFQASQRGLLLVLALVLGLVVVAPPAARAAGSNCTVNGAGGADYTTIQAAVDDTGCTTISVAAGTYQEHVAIGRDVTISGAGASSTTIDGTHSGTVFTITSGTVTLQYLTIANGSGDTSGGIYNSGGSVTVSNSTVSGNSASFGGGIRNHAILTVSNSTISGNSVGSFRGGGLFNEGTLTVSNSTVSGNSATLGGGIFNHVGSVTVGNSTVSGNSADTGNGGGIFNNAHGTLTVNNSTLAGNSASFGGGLLNNGGSLTVSNTIIANSPSGADCAGSLNNDSGGNLADDGSCDFTAASSRNSTDPKLDLAGLKDNGGPTKTIALLMGSPAIDTAVSCPTPATDQRGIARPQGSGCDIGAFELEQQPAFAWNGFFAPVDNLPMLNQAKAGATIPVKFSLGSNYGLTIFASGSPSFTQTACSSGDPVASVETSVSAGQSGLSYDADSGQYTYVWKTDRQWAGKCGTLTLSFIDGSQHTANFKFTR
jgi:hypothetical protein